MFRTNGEWLVNEMEVFGSGELLSSSPDADFPRELDDMADSIVANLISSVI